MSDSFFHDLSPLILALCTQGGADGAEDPLAG